eukprot:sb/3475506/
MSYGHFNGTHPSPKITGHAKTVRPRFRGPQKLTLSDTPIKWTRTFPPRVSLNRGPTVPTRIIALCIHNARFPCPKWCGCYGNQSSCYGNHDSCYGNQNSCYGNQCSCLGDPAYVSRDRHRAGQTPC